MSEKRHIIYTDGGCYQSIGSWAWVEVDQNDLATDIKELGKHIIIRNNGYIYNTTNNRMELIAIINAVNSINAGGHINIFSDSGYCVTGHNDPSYLRKWVQNGWRTSKKQPVENQDLWEKMLILDLMYDVKYYLVKGHMKDKNNPHTNWNNLCDKMCTEMREFATSNKDTLENILIPNECPTDCKFKDQMGDQNGYCHSCPVILCKEPDPLVPLADFRCDWLVEWGKFFDGEIAEPDLKFSKE